MRRAAAAVAIVVTATLFAPHAQGAVTAIGNFLRLHLGSGRGTTISVGSGSPESSISGAVGDVFFRTDGRSDQATTVYTKESGSSTTGWGVVGNIKTATRRLTDAEVKALPTTRLLLVAAPGTNVVHRRIRVIAVSTYVGAGLGGYTNINATYADIHIENAAAEYIAYGPANDSSATPVLTQLTDFLAVNDKVVDWLHPVSGDNTGYVFSNQTFDPTNQQGALYLKVDNNGSGALTGGNANNWLIVTVYYAVEGML